MLKKIKIHLTTFLAVALTFSSCTEDLGNYDYIDINEVSISGIEESYVINRLDNFNITPELSFTQDDDTEGRYTYKWQSYKVSGAGLDSDKLIELSTERNLTAVASMIPGNHVIYYTVKDTETGVEWEYNFNVEVTNSLYEGWLVLNEVDGGARLDMISLSDEEYKPIHDVLGLAKSNLVLEGTPGFVSTARISSREYGIYVSTSGNGTVKLEQDTFEWAETFTLAQEFGTNQPNDLEAQAVLEKGGYRAFCVVDGNFYYRYYLLSVLYSTPKNLINGERFEASPMIGVGHSANKTIIYDNTNLRFVYYNGGGSCFTIPTANNTRFNYNTGKELVHLVSTNYNGSIGRQNFAILKDPADDKFYMARFNSDNFRQLFYDEITPTDFEQATNIAISPEFGYVFYSIGGKVYQYDAITKQTILMLDKGDSEISLLKFHDFRGSVERNTLGNDLIVATVDPSLPEGANGTFELYDVPPVNGQIQLINSFDGFGKIVSVSFRNR